MKAFSRIKKDIDQDDRVTFGKHSGNTWFYVMENFPDYIIWCVGNTDMKFSYQLIVDAIKSKYAIKKRNKTEEIDGVYVPAIGEAVFNKHHGDAFGSLHSDDWDNDVPF